MPRFLVERLFEHISDDDMLAAATRSEEVRQGEFPNLTWEVTHVCVESDGSITTFCVYSAPDEEEIRRHADIYGYHVVGRVWEIVEDMTPEKLQQRLAAAG
jgi:hypothetical protein